MPASSASAGLGFVVPAATVTAVAAISLTLLALSFTKSRGTRAGDDDDDRRPSSSTASSNLDSIMITKGGYEALIGNTPLVYLPHISSLLPNQTKIYVKMESMNPGGTGKDRAARSMILDAERRGELPPPLRRDLSNVDGSAHEHGRSSDNDTPKMQTPQLSNNCKNDNDHQSPSSSPSSFSNIPTNIHKIILAALHNTKTHGILIEGTSGSTGISLASLSCSRGHSVIVVMPDDQSKQKVDFLKKLGCGVVVVQNCSISNPGHYVNVARRVYEWLQKERRYDEYYWENVVSKRNNGNGNAQQTATTASSQQQPPPKLIQAAFMNQFENLANVQSHYRTTGPEIYSQLDGNVDAFVMSAGTGGTIVGTGGYLKERYHQDRADEQKDDISSQSSIQQCNQSSPPRIVLVDPPGSSLFNKVKYGVAYAAQQSEQKLRRHRYDTLAEGIGLDRITANFGLGCESIAWGSTVCGRGRKGAFGSRIAGLLSNHDTTAGHPNEPYQSPKLPTNNHQSKIIDDAVSITDQQAVYMAHFLLRHEGLFVGSSTSMNVAGALMVASKMPRGSNVVTVVCDGGQRSTGRFWNRDFIVGERGLVWPGDDDDDVGDAIVDAGMRGKDDILECLGIDFESSVQ